MSTNTPWPVKVERKLRAQRAREAMLAIALILFVLALVFGGALLLTGCMAHSDWMPQAGCTLTDVERIMERRADRIAGDEARWFLPNGEIEAYAKFDRILWLRGIIVLENGEPRQRHEFEVPRLVDWTYYYSSYNSMEPKP